MTEFYILDGQKIAFNSEMKILKTTIREPFFTAGKRLGWIGRTAGLGINKKITEKLLRTNATLIIYVESSDRDYFLRCDRLKRFLLHNHHDYRTPKGVTVDVIPWDLFTHKIEHSGEL